MKSILNKIIKKSFGSISPRDREIQIAENASGKKLESDGDEVYEQWSDSE